MGTALRFINLILLALVMKDCLAGPLDHRRVRRIVGGMTAKGPSEVPYVVSVQRYNSGTRSYNHICGGAILNPTTILSAGHCAWADDNNEDIPNYRIVAGEYNLDEPEESEQPVEIDEIVLLSNYNAETMENDIAVMFLNEPLTFNQYVQPIKLPKWGHVSTGSSVLAGWGADQFDFDEYFYDTGESRLKLVTMNIFSSEECQERIFPNLSPSFMCAGNWSGDADACFGDSGSPLVTKTDEGEEYVAGIVSWGVGCGIPGTVGLYTNVSHFVPWISELMKLYGDVEVQFIH